jgi:branched-chain amino acid transport system substrate-binding protein
MHYAADAVKRAGSTEADKLVDALEKTDWLGTVGRIQFYGKDETFTHSIKYGPGFVTGLLAQWQAGKQVAIWPAAVANGTLILPPAVKPAVQ